MVRGASRNGFRLDKQGNYAADVLARRSGAAHALDRGYALQLRNGRRPTVDIQNMMCDIVQARAERGPLAALESVGSDDDMDGVISIGSDSDGIASDGEDCGACILISSDSDEEELIQRAGADCRQGSHAAPRARDPG